MVLLGLIIGSLLLGLMGAFVWVLYDFRRYKKNNHFVLLALLIIAPASLFARNTNLQTADELLSTPMVKQITGPLFERNISTSGDLLLLSSTAFASAMGSTTVNLTNE